MKKISVCILIAFCASMFSWLTPVHAENETSIIVATGQDVPTDDNLLEEYRFPEEYRDNAVQFRTEDGVLLCGYVLGDGNKGITLAHAKGWMVKSWLPFAERLVDQGYMVILWEFRNTAPSGSAEGEASERWDLDVLAAAQVLRERGATEILSMGASYGGTSTAVAATHIPDLVGLGILSSPADVPPENALEAVQKIDVPAFFAVSRNDFQGSPGVYYDEVKALYDACASEQKQFHGIDGSDHGTDMITPDVPGVGYAVFPKNAEQKQKRVELADDLTLFVNDAFGKSTHEPEGGKTDAQTSTPGTGETIDRSESSNGSATIYLLITGLGALLVLIVIVTMLNIKGKK